MKEKPILFSTPMIQAILEGRKSQTRRIMKPQPHRIATEVIKSSQFKKGDFIARFKYLDEEIYEITNIFKCPYGQPGDTLWVKETYYAYGMWLRNGHNKSGKQSFRFSDTTLTGFKYHYCDDPPENVLPNTKREVYGWFKRPSLFMPHKAARILLRVIDIRVERLQDISEEDAIAEGVSLPNYVDQAIRDVRYPDPSTIYAELWESINGKGSWDANPWVWVIKFERI